MADVRITTASCPLRADERVKRGRLPRCGASRCVGAASPECFPTHENFCLTNRFDRCKILLCASAHIARGDVAQLGEHHVRNVGAEGSNPFISTTIFYGLGIAPGPFCVSARGIRTVRSGAVKRTCLRHVLRRLPDRACEGGPRAFAAGGRGNPFISTTEIRQAWQTAKPVLRFNSRDSNRGAGLPAGVDAAWMKNR